MRIFNKISIVIFLILLTSVFGFSQTAEKITASTIVSDLIKKKKQNPKISNQELANYANEVLAKEGFNYNFEMSELFNQKSSQKDFPDNMKEFVINFPFEFSLNRDSKKTFNLTAKKNLMNQCYDQSFPAFPVIQVTESKATVLVEGKPVTINIPKEFRGLDISLVDAKTKKKVIQKWLIPNNYGITEENFVGISLDGKKLYVAVEDSYLIDYPPVKVKELALEISADGQLRFVTKASVKKKFKLDYVQNLKIEEEGNLLQKVTVSGKTYYFVSPNTDC